MNATIKNMVSCHIMRDMKIISSNVDYSKIVSWCNVVRDVSQVDYAKNGELLVVEESAMKFTEKGINEFFTRVQNTNISGIIFLRDKEMNEVLLNILDSISKEQKIVLFTANNSKTSDEYAKIINREICLLEDKMLLEQNLLTEFLFKDRKKLICAIERSENVGLDFNAYYEAAIVYSDIANESADNLEYALRQFQNFISQRYGKNGLFMRWEDMLVCVFETDEEDEISKELYDAFVEYESRNDGIKSRLKIVMGRSVTPLSKIRASFDQALYTRDVYELIKGKGNVRTYNDVGIYKLLRSSHNPHEFKKYYMENLGKLLSYDKDNNTNLVGTLEVYIFNNCNMINTADELYLHKNSLRYRLQRIEEIMEIDLKDITIIANLYIAFCVRNYLGFTENK